MAWSDIDNLDVYRLGMKIGEKTYQLIGKLNQFDKNTIGYQLMRAADSIAANISEGYGRYYYREQKQFCYYARGSVYEAKTWLQKVMERNYTLTKDIVDILELIESLHFKLNAYIKYLNGRL